MARRRRMHTPTPRRKRVWADQQWADVGFAEDSLRTENLLADYISQGGSTQGITVVRTLLWITWGINESHTAQDYIEFGLIKGTLTAADTADVHTEPYADWAWIDRPSTGLCSGLLTADAPEYYSADVKSARKIDEIGETWWLIYKGTAPATTTATYDVRGRARTLLLLP